jgi:tetratricopeptide (TPR) repeat protein
MEISLKQIKEQLKSNDFSKTLDLINQAIEQRILYPEILILKANCLQISDKGKETLEDIQRIYEQALTIDENYCNALIELGYFNYAVMDNAKLGKNYFNKALTLLKSKLNETIVGLGKCIEEIDSQEAATKFIHEIKSNLLETSEINEYLQQLKD